MGMRQIRVAIDDEVGQDVLSAEEVERIVCAVLAGEGCVEPCEVSVSFVDEDAIHALNREYRGIDRPTDVLSFNMDDPDEFFDAVTDGFEEGLAGGDGVPGDMQDAFMLGDVVVCPAVVAAQAPGFGNSVADEMRLLLVHGCLHLMGYDHEDPVEAEEMEDLERRYLAPFAGVAADELNVGPTADHAAEGSAAAPRGDAR